MDCYVFRKTFVDKRSLAGEVFHKLPTTVEIVHASVGYTVRSRVEGLWARDTCWRLTRSGAMRTARRFIGELVLDGYAEEVKRDAD